MTQTLVLTGDIHLGHVADPAEPFALVRDVLGGADVVFGNLEGCLYDPSVTVDYKPGWHHVGPEPAPALQHGGFPRPRVRQQRELRRRGYHGDGGAAGRDGHCPHRRGARQGSRPRARHRRARRRPVRLPAIQVRVLAPRPRGLGRQPRSRRDTRPHRIPAQSAHRRDAGRAADRRDVARRRVPRRVQARRRGAAGARRLPGRLLPLGAYPAASRRPTTRWPSLTRPSTRAPIWSWATGRTRSRRSSYTAASRSSTPWATSSSERSRCTISSAWPPSWSSRTGTPSRCAASRYAPNPRSQTRIRAFVDEPEAGKSLETLSRRFDTTIEIGDREAVVWRRG